MKTAGGHVVTPGQPMQHNTNGLAHGCMVAPSAQLRRIGATLRQLHSFPCRNLRPGERIPSPLTMNLRQLRNISRTLMHSCGLARSAMSVPCRELAGRRMRRGWLSLRQWLTLLVLLSGMAASQAETNATNAINATIEKHAPSATPAASVVPILLYHRFVPNAADRPAPNAEYLARRMTMGIETLAAQLKYLREAGYTIVPLRQVVEAGPMTA